MKLLGTLVIALFGVTSFAVKYAPGANCHTNRDCNNVCVDGVWTIMKVEGDYQLVCDPGTADTKQYYAATCFDPKQNLDEAVAAGCDKLGGSVCNDQCFLSGKRTTQEDISKQWSEVCKPLNATPLFTAYISAEAAVKYEYGCDANKLFGNNKRNVAFEV